MDSGSTMGRFLNALPQDTLKWVLQKRICYRFQQDLHKQVRFHLSIPMGICRSAYDQIRQTIAIEA